MSIVKSKDKRSGITYVYESESYWDKEKKQPRSRRHLVGRLDEETGEVVPTDGRGKNRRNTKNKDASDTTLLSSATEEQLRARELEVKELRAEIAALKKERNRIKAQLQKMLSIFTD